MYEQMATLQVMDHIFYEAQRQGRISFYLTSVGEEAINIASAAALTPDDVVLPQVSRRTLVSPLIDSGRFDLTGGDSVKFWVTVPRARSASMAWLHVGRVCESVLWEQS